MNPSENSKPQLYFFVLILLAAWIRLSFSQFAQFTNHDCSMVGIMAHQWIHQGRFEAFFYGESYSGTFESLVSGLFFALFGENTRSLMGTMVFFSLGTLIFTFLLAKECFHPRVGLFALALLLFPSSEALLYSFYPRVVYASTPFFSMALLWAALRCGRTEKTRYFFLMGILLGLGWWNHALIVYAAAASFFFLLIFKPGIFLLKRAYVAIPAFFIGSLPWWCYNFQTGFRSVANLADQPDTPLQKALFRIFTVQIPDLFFQTGLSLSPSEKWEYGFGIVVSVVAFAWGCQSYFKKKSLEETSKDRSSAWILLLMIASTLLIFWLYRFRRFPMSRYLLPCYFPAILVMAQGFHELFLKRKMAALALLLLFVGVQADFTWKWREQFLADDRNHSEIFRTDFLDPIRQLNRPSGVTTDWGDNIESSAVDFWTQGQFQLAHINGERDRFVEWKTDACESPYLAYSTFKHPYREILDKMLPLSFETPVSNNNLTILDSIRLHPGQAYRSIPFTELFLSGLKAYEKNTLFDRNSKTFLTSPKAPSQGYEIKVQSEHPVSLSRILLVPFNKKFPSDLRLKLFSSSDGRSWDEFQNVEAPPVIYQLSHKIYFNGASPMYEFHRPERTPVSFWKVWTNHPITLSEMHCFEHAPDLSEVPCEISSLIPFIEQQGIEKIFIERHKGAKLILSRKLSKAKIVEPPNPYQWAPPRPEERFLPWKEKTLIVTDTSFASDIRMFLDAWEFQYETRILDGLECFYDFDKRPRNVDISWKQVGMLVDDLPENCFLPLFESWKSNSKKNPPSLAAIKLLSDWAPTQEKFLNAVSPESMPPSLLRERLRVNRELFVTKNPRRCDVLFESQVHLSFIEIKCVDPGHIQATLHLALNQKIQDELACFLHFLKKDTIVFQDDFVLNEDLKNHWVSGETHRYERVISIPESANLAELQAVFGVWKPRTQKKLGVQTDSFPLYQEKAILIPIERKAE